MSLCIRDGEPWPLDLQMFVGLGVSLLLFVGLGLSLRLFVGLAVSLRLVVGLSLRLSVGLSLRLSVGLSLRLSVGLFLRLSLGLSLRLSVGLPGLRLVPCFLLSMSKVGLVCFTTCENSRLAFTAVLRRAPSLLVLLSASALPLMAEADVKSRTRG